MTREEAIHELGEWLEQMIQHGVPSHSAKRKALAKAINALAVYPQFKWERDIAIEQLDEYGISFGAKKDDDIVKVVRCKDCEASRVYGKTTQWLACEDVMEGQATDPDGYCYLGKRREEGEA